MNQQRQEFYGARQYGQDRQAEDWYDGHPRTYSRGAPPRRRMQPSFFRGGWGLAEREIIIHFRGKQQSRGKTWGKGKGGLRVVIIVIIWGDVLGGLVPPPT